MQCMCGKSLLCMCVLLMHSQVKELFWTAPSSAIMYLPVWATTRGSSAKKVRSVCACACAYILYTYYIILLLLIIVVLIFIIIFVIAGFMSYEKLRYQTLRCLPRPHYILYLEAAPQVCSERLQKRGRVSSSPVQGIASNGRLMECQAN